MGVMKLYGMYGSTCTALVLLCLEEVGAEYELISVNVLAGEQKVLAHLARNPFGQIPALEDGEVVIFESRAISRYVLRKHKANIDLLRLSNLSESTSIDVWLEAEAHQYNPAISPILYQSIILPKFYKGNPDLLVVDSSLEKFKKVLEVYEARLCKNKYMAGDFFSLADISYFPSTYYFMLTPYASVFESYPRVKMWWDDVSSRPACMKVAAGISEFLERYM